MKELDLHIKIVKILRKRHKCVDDLFKYAKKDIFHRSLIKEFGILDYLIIMNEKAIERGDKDWEELDFTTIKILLKHKEIE